MVLLYQENIFLAPEIIYMSVAHFKPRDELTNSRTKRRVTEPK